MALTSPISRGGGATPLILTGSRRRVIPNSRYSCDSSANSWPPFCIFTWNLWIQSPEPPDFTLWIRSLLLSSKIITNSPDRRLFFYYCFFNASKVCKEGHTHFVRRCDSRAPISHVTESSWISDEASPRPSARRREVTSRPAGVRRRSMPAAAALGCSHQRNARHCGFDSWFREKLQQIGCLSSEWKSAINCRKNHCFYIASVTGPIYLFQMSDKRFGFWKWNMPCIGQMTPLNWGKTSFGLSCFNNKHFLFIRNMRIPQQCCIPRNMSSSLQIIFQQFLHHISRVCARVRTCNSLLRQLTVKPAAIVVSHVFQI